MVTAKGNRGNGVVLSWEGATGRRGVEKSEGVPAISFSSLTCRVDRRDPAILPRLEKPQPGLRRVDERIVPRPRSRATLRACLCRSRARLPDGCWESSTTTCSWLRFPRLHHRSRESSYND